MGTPCLSRPKEPSLFSPAGALLLLDSWRSPHSPALHSLASPTSDVDRSESVCCPGNAAKSRGDHESAQTLPCDKFCNKNDLVLSHYLWDQLQRIAQHHSSPILSSFCMFSRKVTVAGAHLRHSCVTSLVSPNQGRERVGFCSTCFNRLKTSSKPVNSQCAWKSWQMKEISGVWARNFAELQTTRWKENNMCWWKQVILTRHNGVKKLCPFLSTDRTTPTDYFVTSRIDGRDSGIGGKSGLKRKQRIWGTAVERHYEILQFEYYIPSSKPFSNNVRLWSRPEKSTVVDALLDLLCLLVSASVEMSPSPKSTAGTSTGAEKEQRWKRPKSPPIQNVDYFIIDS